MSFMTCIQRCLVANALTVYYTAATLISFLFTYLRNPCTNPFKLNLRSVPPSSLADPKYGVHKYLTANAIKLHYVESGDSSKPLMLFLHGYPGFWYSWRQQIVEFQKDYWCVAVDMRGYGDSERPEGVSSYKINLLVDDVRDFLRQLGRDKCILVGHDWGGVVACKFRDTYPDALHALIMFGSTSWDAWFHEIWNNPAQRLESWYVFLYRMPFIPELMMQMNDLAVFDILLGRQDEQITNCSYTECYKYWFGKQYALTPPINYYRANFKWNVTKKFKVDNVPMLVANGELDQYIQPNVLEVIKEEYKYAETKLVKDCTHFMLHEVPEKVNKIIRDFLTKNNL